MQPDEATTMVSVINEDGTRSKPISIDNQDELNSCLESYLASAGAYVVDNDAPKGDEKFWIPDSVGFKAIVRAVINRCFSDLVDVNILWMFRLEHTISQGKIVCAKTTKQSEQQRAIHGHAVVITIAWDIWQKITPIQREALLYHELRHVGFDDENGKVELYPHDVEMFTDELKRYGAWNSDLKALVEGMRGQMSLFDGHQHDQTSEKKADCDQN